MLEIVCSKRTTWNTKLEVRLQKASIIFKFEIVMLESFVDFPVIAFENRTMVIASDSGVGLKMFFLETFEMLINTKSTIVESILMKEGEDELGEETLRIVMLLFDEIFPVISINSATERSWM